MKKVTNVFTKKVCLHSRLFSFPDTPTLLGIELIHLMVDLDKAVPTRVEATTPFQRSQKCASYNLS